MLIAAGILALGAGLFGGIAAGQASRARQEMAEANQANALREAGELEEAKQMALSDISYQGGRVVGQQKARIGASGVKMSGSPLAAISESYKNIERDLVRTGKQYDFEIGARKFEAGQYAAGAEAEKKTRPWNFLSSFLGSGASAFSSFAGV